MSQTLVPAIPSVTQDNLLDVARSVKNILDVREGKIGDPLDANVTFRDLLTSGLAKEQVGYNFANRNTISPVLSWYADDNGYDPTTDLLPPPAPTGLSAASGMTTIQLQWDNPTYRNHAYTEVWRAASNSLGSAVRIGTTNFNLYSDAVGKTSQTYYYWIRHVTQADVSGPYNATSGVVGSTGLVGNADLTDLIVTAAKLADGAVTSGKIGTSAVTSAKLADLSVEAAKLADSSVTATKIANLAVGTAAISDAAITSAKIAALAVGNAAIANGAITNAKIGDLAVDSAKIADAAIVTAKIADLSVSSGKIIDAAITNAKIGAAAITTAKIADAAITAAKIGDAEITSAKIASAAITAAKIADATITAAKIGDGEVTNAKIGNTIQSTNFVSGSTGWRIEKAGSAEFNGVVLSRQLQVDSGTYSGYVNTTAGASLDVRATFYVETNTDSVAWSGTDKTYMALVSLSGATVYANSADVNSRPEMIQWGMSAEVIPITRWSGAARIFLKITVYGRLTISVGGDFNWYLFKVT
jgi:hypothetical protein